MQHAQKLEEIINLLDKNLLTQTKNTKQELVNLDERLRNLSPQITVARQRKILEVLNCNLISSAPNKRVTQALGKTKNLELKLHQLM